MPYSFDTRAVQVVTLDSVLATVHDESSSRDPHRQPDSDLALSRERYGAFRTIGDPFYSPALTLAATDCALRGPDEAAVP